MQTETADRISELTESALEQLQLNLTAGKSDTLKAYLATMARFHRYSFGNQLLIAFQNPLATHVAGFHAWRKLGRFHPRRRPDCLGDQSDGDPSPSGVSADGTRSWKCGYCD